MATGEQYIKRALIKAGIRSAESPITADEIQDGLEQFNDMMSSQEAAGLVLGFTRLTNATESVTIPDHAQGAVKAALAVYLSAEYGRQASPVLVAEAANLYTQVRRVIVKIPAVAYPSTLPLGSGNGVYNGLDSVFFSGEDSV